MSDNWTPPTRRELWESILEKGPEYSLDGSGKDCCRIVYVILGGALFIVGLLITDKEGNWLASAHKMKDSSRSYRYYPYVDGSRRATTYWKTHNECFGSLKDAAHWIWGESLKEGALFDLKCILLGPLRCLADEAD